MDHKQKSTMESLQQTALKMGITLTSFQITQFESYYAKLIEWNQKFNLTRITAQDEVISKHFLDSLTCLTVLPQLPHQVIDIGTGAGFPGLVLKIAQPHIQLTLVEATGKKVRFLTHLISALRLTGVIAIHHRAEEVGHMVEHRGRYQLAVARAVAPLPVLAEYMLPVLKQDGLMLAQKGTTPTYELHTASKALQILGGSFQRTFSATIPGLSAERHLILVKKVKPTPEKYPRRPGIPIKKPII